MAGLHKRKSASGAEKFISCPGSLTREDLVPPEESPDEEWSVEGTAAHALGEKCLREQTEPWMHMGEIMEAHGEELTDFPVNTDMSEAVQVYVDYVRSMYGDDCDSFIEMSIDNPEVGEDFGGTADYVAYRVKDGGGFIHVMDYKHGIGISVDIDDNKQLLYYAYGVILLLGIEKGEGMNVGITIVQPRGFHSEGSIRERWVSSDDVYDWAEEILLPGMKKADAADAPLCLGEHCRFCRAKLWACEAMTENFRKLLEDGDPADEKEDKARLKSITDDELALEWERVAPARMRIKAINIEAYRRSMLGRKIAGTKLIAGRVDRVWKEGAEDAAKKKLGDDAWETKPKFLSPAQAEKKLVGGKDFAAEWAHKPVEKAKAVLVSENDKGAELTPRDGAKTFAGVKTP